VVSFANAHAAALGVAPGMTCREAAECLRAASVPAGTLSTGRDTRVVLHPGNAHATDDRGPRFDRRRARSDRGVVLVIGSHGALHGGAPSSALSVDAAGAIFHDAGGGRDGRRPYAAAGARRARIPAATVAHTSARIGDARSMWATRHAARASTPRPRRRQLSTGNARRRRGAALARAGARR
jgi:hypothetical protein